MQVEINTDRIKVIAEEMGESFLLGEIAATLDQQLIRFSSTLPDDMDCWLQIRFADIAPAKKDTTDGS